jgi:hypothetical protein
MRASKSGWPRDDLETLYIGYGFVVSHGSSDDKVKHPQFPALRAKLARHRDLAKSYVTYAIALIEKLEELKAGGPDVARVD